MTPGKALLVGVESCPAADLLGPGHDVALVGAVVRDRFGLAIEVVPNSQATRDGILAALDRLVSSAAPGDALLFYFAGHGTQVDGRLGDEEVLREAICPHDFTREDPSRAIRDDELHERFAVARARGAALTAIFDCCFAGGLAMKDIDRGSGSAAARTRSIASASANTRAPRRVLRIADLGAGRSDHGDVAATVIFGACVAGGLAEEQPFGDEFHGVFTHHLTAVLSLRGPGVTNIEVQDAVRRATAEGHPQLAVFAPPAAASAAFLEPGPRTSIAPAPRPPQVPTASASMFRRPLKVHIAWSPRDTEAVRELAVSIHGFFSRPLADDAVLRPGMGIPVEVGRDLATLAEQLAAHAEAPVDARIVVVIVGPGGYADAGFRRAMDRVIDLAAADRGIVVIPIALDPAWYASWPVAGLDAIAAVCADGDALAPGPDRMWKLGADLGIAAARALFGPDDAAAAPQIFISHAQADIDGSDRLALRLRDRIASATRLRPELDQHDAKSGTWLREQLRRQPRAGVLLVVRTDSYSESPRCTEELLVAKAERVPIVTVLSTSLGEPHASAYGGNHRTVHWQPGREWEVIGRCVQAWLHHHHFLAFGRAALELAGLPVDSLLLSRRPELLDLASGTRGLVVYPDPPMPEAERDVLRANRPDVRVATPSTLYGRVLLDRDTAPPLANVTLAFSLSYNTWLAPLDRVDVGAGITRAHLTDALDSVILSTIHSGARIAYGGDLRRGGISERMSNLLLAHRRLGLGGRPQLLCYQAERARDGDGRVVYEPVEVAAPPGTAELDDADLRESAWELAMRRASSRATTGRIAMSGKSRPRSVDGSGGYRLPWPGMLEEAWRTVKAGRALYLVGGYGGCAGDLAQMLVAGEVPTALRHATYAGNPDFDEMTRRWEAARARLAAIPGADHDLLLMADDRPLRMDDLAADLLAAWQGVGPDGRPTWSNGLTRAENLALFASTDTTEISHLVFSGLARLQRATDRSRSLALRCYHGDIASIPGVDAYAVTITPGMERLGAAAALDARCGGRLRRVAAGRDLEVVEVGSSALAGRHILVVPLELPAAASTIDVATIEDLAARVGAECQRIGLVSIACAPFGATLGVGVGDAVRAMLAGFERAGAPETVTFCEIDLGRIELLRAALPPGGFEDLREGPLPPLALERAVLYLRGRAPTAEVAGVIEANLYHDALGATVPCGAGDPIDLATWDALRSPAATMAGVAAQGERLLSRLLPPRVQAELCAHPDAVLSIVLDETASGLPWESIGHADPAWTPAIAVPLTRRIALGDAQSPSPAARRGARLRALVVSDTRGDLEGARDEAKAVIDLLRQRADLDVVAISGADATLEHVQRTLADGTWDVFHYAGHAFFDPEARQDSGLMLADAVLRAQYLALQDRVPRLIVLGACESARVRGPGDAEVDPRPARWSLAEGLLRRGVRSLIGTFFVVSDAAARDFSTSVYGGLLAGRQLGTAVRDARQLLHRSGAPDWANFLLYGDGGLTL